VQLWFSAVVHAVHHLHRCVCNCLGLATVGVVTSHEPVWVVVPSCLRSMGWTHNNVTPASVCLVPMAPHGQLVPYLTGFDCCAPTRAVTLSSGSCERVCTAQACVAPEVRLPSLFAV
jgi:hypothetical protein